MATGNAQIFINYGASPNDGTGDQLRTAFIKTDENFDNIWLAGPVGSNIRITNNSITSINTNGNIILSPNGTGVIEVKNNIVPHANDTYNLGSSTRSFRSLYVGIGGISTTGGISVGGVASVGVFTAVNLTAIAGSVGQIAAVSDSPTAGGQLAFWDTTNNRWSYVSDNSAV